MKSVNSNLFKLLGIIPFPVFIITILLLAVSGINLPLESPLLLAILNTVFNFFVPFIVSCISVKSYLKYRLLNLLLLGAGLLAFGLGGLFAALVVNTPDGANRNVTVFNIGVLAASVFQAASAVLTYKGLEARKAEKTEKLKVILLYVGVLVFMLVVTTATLQSVIPTFFVQGVGPTLLRQVVLGTAIGLFAFSSFIFIIVYYKSKADVLYWYSLALALIATGLFAVFIQTIVGGPVGWVGRTTQYIGGIYFLIAILRSYKSAKESTT